VAKQVFIPKVFSLAHRVVIRQANESRYGSKRMRLLASSSPSAAAFASLSSRVADTQVSQKPIPQVSGLVTTRLGVNAS
jgi:hypothetical protein